MKTLLLLLGIINLAYGIKSLVRRERWWRMAFSTAVGTLCLALV